MVMDWRGSKVSVGRGLVLGLGLVVILCDPGHARGPAGNARPAAAPLLVRGRIELTLAGAREVVAGAEAKAEALGIKENIAIVDSGGHLLAFERMDGARPASAATAITKAETAATMRQATGPVHPRGAAPDPLLNLSLQNAAAASGGKITTLPGGVPITIEGQVIGAIGVGGATGDQDLEVARAGVERLIQKIAAGRGENPPPRSAALGSLVGGGELF